MNKTLGIAALIALAPSLSVADNYFGIDLVSQDVEFTEGTAELSLKSLQGRLGKQLTDFVAIEGRAAFNIVDDAVTTDVDASISSSIGAYLKAGLPINEQSSLYALAGLTHATLEFTAFGDSIDDAQISPSVGLGFDFFFNDQAGITLEYIKLVDADYNLPELGAGDFPVEASGFSIGYISKF